MIESSEVPSAHFAALSKLTACIDELLGLPTANASDDELRAAVRQLESQLRRLHAARLRQLAEVAERNISGRLGLRSLPDLIQIELLCTRREARELALAADRFCLRRALTGEPLQPRYPLIARAIAEGRLGATHAKVIADLIEELPATVRAEHGPQVEKTLVELAHEKEPAAVRLLGQRIAAHLDPDGPVPDEVDRQQHARRRLHLNRRGNSTGELTGDLTAACQAVWEAVLAPLAAKRPDGSLGPDLRTASQRMHDAFEEAGRMLLASGSLPARAGVASTVVITMSLTDLERRAGVATTHHGGTLSIAEALRLAAGGDFIPAVLNDAGGVLSYGRRRRLASRGQRQALFARDRGCTFPDCTKPAARSEIHHLTEWARGGRTDVDSMAIACGYHNNEAPRQGWQTMMVDGIPHWKPPPWQDPDQIPIRNYLHHPELLNAPD